LCFSSSSSSYYYYYYYYHYHYYYYYYYNYYYYYYDRSIRRYLWLSYWRQVWRDELLLFLHPLQCQPDGEW